MLLTGPEYMDISRFFTNSVKIDTPITPQFAQIIPQLYPNYTLITPQTNQPRFNMCQSEKYLFGYLHYMMSLNVNPTKTKLPKLVRHQISKFPYGYLLSMTSLNINNGGNSIESPPKTTVLTRLHYVGWQVPVLAPNRFVAQPKLTLGKELWIWQIPQINYAATCKRISLYVSEPCSKIYYTIINTKFKFLRDGRAKSPNHDLRRSADEWVIFLDRPVDAENPRQKSIQNLPAKSFVGVVTKTRYLSQNANIEFSAFLPIQTMKFTHFQNARLLSCARATRAPNCNGPVKLQIHSVSCPLTLSEETGDETDSTITTEDEDRLLDEAVKSPTKPPKNKEKMLKTTPNEASDEFELTPSNRSVKSRTQPVTGDDSKQKRNAKHRKNQKAKRQDELTKLR